jgi:hypothetical protein
LLLRLVYYLRHVDKFFHLVLIAYTKQTNKITKFLNYQDDHLKTSKKLTQFFHSFYLNQIILHNQDLHPRVRLTKHTEDNSKSRIHSIIEFWHIPWYFLWDEEHWYEASICEDERRTSIRQPRERGCVRGCILPQ